RHRPTLTKLTSSQPHSHTQLPAIHSPPATKPQPIFRPLKIPCSRPILTDDALLLDFHAWLTSISSSRSSASTAIRSKASSPSPTTPANTSSLSTETPSTSKKPANSSKKTRPSSNLSNYLHP